MIKKQGSETLYDAASMALLTLGIIVGIIAAIVTFVLKNAPKCLEHGEKTITTTWNTLEAIPQFGLGMTSGFVVFEGKNFMLVFTPLEQDNVGFSKNKVLKPNLNFRLENKTDSSLKIVWDESSYVIDGQSNKVIHAGIRFIDAEKTSVPTFVPPHADINDVAIPISLIEQNEYSHEWEIQNIEIPSVIQLFLTIKVGNQNSALYEFRWDVQKKKESKRRTIRVCTKWEERKKD